jgi:integrase
MAATAHLPLVAPDNEKCTVQSAPARLPRRKPNAEYRSREHLTEREVERLIEAMKGNRWGHRDATMILIAFRHGLRASELVDLRWHQIDLEHALLHVRRLKNGSPTTHPLTGRELRALRRLQREQELKSPFVFRSERGTPFTKRGFQAMVERAGKATGFNMKIHPHMLRHACGFSWPTTVWIPERSRPIWATSRFSIRCVTSSWHRLGLKACFETDVAQ